MAFQGRDRKTNAQVVQLIHKTKTQGLNIMTKKKSKPVILITTDGDITSPGLRNLVEAVKDLGKVVVVAPDKPQRGMGHAITIGSPLRMNKMNIFGEVEAWQTTGTPVDCVKLAVDKILHRKPDLCLSG